MAHVQAELGPGAYRQDRLRRVRSRRHTGWLTALALILGEALLAIVLVIAGIAVFAKVKVASQTPVDLRAAGPMTDQPRIGQPQAYAAPVDPDSDNTAAASDTPGAIVAEAHAAIPAVGRAEVGAAPGTGATIALDAQLPSPPPAQVIQSEAAPLPADRSEAQAAIVGAPGTGSAPAPVAAPEAEPQRPDVAAAIARPQAPATTGPPAADAVGADETGSIPRGANPDPGILTDPTAATDTTAKSAQPAKPRQVVKPRPRAHAAAKRVRARQARAPAAPAPSSSPTTFPASTPRTGSSSTPFFQSNRSPQTVGP